ATFSSSCAYAAKLKIVIAAIVRRTNRILFPSAQVCLKTIKHAEGIPRPSFQHHPHAQQKSGPPRARAKTPSDVLTFRSTLWLPPDPCIDHCRHTQSAWA